ncbi:MAG: hypothetical protein PHX78_11780, partial [bacterium]|nr:hypothetical protein [bacterium]
MKNIWMILIVFTLFGCATSYRSRGFNGGYSDTQLDTNVFRVTFNGNSNTTRERVNDFTLLRCAEVALNNGFEFFIIVDSSNSATYGTYTTPATTTTHTDVNVSHNYAHADSEATTYGGQTFITTKPSSTNTIMCYKNKPDINAMI